MLTMQLTKRMALNWMGGTQFQVVCVMNGVSKTYDSFEKAWEVYNQCLAGGFVEADPFWNEPSPQEKKRMEAKRQEQYEKQSIQYMLHQISELTGIPEEGFQVIKIDKQGN